MLSLFIFQCVSKFYADDTLVCVWQQMEMIDCSVSDSLLESVSCVQGARGSRRALSDCESFLVVNTFSCNTLIHTLLIHSHLMGATQCTHNPLLLTEQLHETQWVVLLYRFRGKQCDLGGLYVNYVVTLCLSFGILLKKYIIDCTTQCYINYVKSAPQLQENICINFLWEFNHRTHIIHNKSLKGAL